MITFVAAMIVCFVAGSLMGVGIRNMQVIWNDFQEEREILNGNAE